MKSGRNGRTLPLLAAVLLLISTGLGLLLLLTRPAKSEIWHNERAAFERHIIEHDFESARRSVLRLSRDAVTVQQWEQCLALAGRLRISQANDSRSTSLIRVLSGKAMRLFPGRSHFIAIHAWALARGGDYEEAYALIPSISDPRWINLVAEIRLIHDFGQQSDAEASLSNLTEALSRSSEPEMFRQAAYASQSAELAFNSALLYAASGRYDNALGVLDDLNSDYIWMDDSTPLRHGVNGAAARIAQDAGDLERAIEWLKQRLEETSERRFDSWVDYQLLGDIAWEKYVIQGLDSDIEDARKAWESGIRIAFDLADNAYPEDGWRLLVNLSILEQSQGRQRKATELMDRALDIFPSQGEVVASWALLHRESEPALSQRLITQALSESSDPILGIANLSLDPGTISPRTYLARIWTLFTSVMDSPSVSKSSTEIVTKFVLQYLVGRRDYDSLDIAIDRYGRQRGADAWILSWRLSADVSRGYPYLNLIPMAPDTDSVYQRFQDFSAQSGSWRGYHDLALFSLLTNRYFTQRSGLVIPRTSTLDMVDPTQAILWMAREDRRLSGIVDSPLGDRLDILIQAYEGSVSLGTISGSGRRIAQIRLENSLALQSLMLRLHESALGFLDKALVLLDRDGSLDIEEKASFHSDILLLKAHFLFDIGSIEQSHESARRALDLNPDNARARDFVRKGGV